MCSYIDYMTSPEVNFGYYMLLYVLQEPYGLEIVESHMVLYLSSLVLLLCMSVNMLAFHFPYYGKEIIICSMVNFCASSCEKKKLNNVLAYLLHSGLDEFLVFLSIKDIDILTS